MRVVADTNVVIAGLLWQGPPRQLLQAAHGGPLTLFTSATMLAELEDVLKRPQFAKRLNLAGAQAEEVMPPADIGAGSVPSVQECLWPGNGCLNVRF